MTIPKEEAKQIAETTCRYLGGTNALKLMIGASNFSYDRDGSLLFKFKMCKKYNAVRFVLSQDLYTMKFYRSSVKNPCSEPKKEIEGLFFDQLREVFERETGLTLYVPKIIGINC